MLIPKVKVKIKIKVFILKIFKEFLDQNLNNIIIFELNYIIKQINNVLNLQNINGYIFYTIKVLINLFNLMF